MNVIHTISSQDVFGPEKTVINECLALNSLGWNCSIMNFWPTEDIPFSRKVRAAGVPYKCVATSSKISMQIVRDIISAHDEAAGSENLPTVVHSHGYKADIHTWLAGRKAGIPIMTTIHGFTSENAKVRLYEWLQSRLWKGFDSVLCVSESYGKVALRAGVDNKKLTLVPNGILSSYAAVSKRDEIRTVLQLPSDAIVTAIVGRLGPEKGHENFLYAAQQVCQQEPRARFVIVGDGPLREQLATRCAELNIVDKVLLLGHRNDTRDLYAAFDILAIASVREGLPNVLLEAMLNGMAIVATSVGGIPEVVRDGESALLVPSQNREALAAAVLRVVMSAELRRSLGARALQRVREEYLFEKRTERMIAAYRAAFEVALKKQRKVHSK